MPHRSPTKLVLGLTLWAMPFRVDAQCSTTYEAVIVDAPSCRFMPLGSGHGIAEDGSITGNYACFIGAYHAFAWFNGPPIVTIPTPSGWTDMVGECLNTAGMIAGHRTWPSPHLAFSYFNGQTAPLPLLPNGTESQAYAIQQVPPYWIVGMCLNSNTGNPPTTPVIWKDGGATIVPLTVTYGSRGTAHDINDNGQIVGWMGPAIQFAHGFLWSDGVMTDLGLPEGAIRSRAFGINNKGVICGFCQAEEPGSPQRAWVWHDVTQDSKGGQYTTIDPLPGHTACIAHDINDDGVVVGHSWGGGTRPGDGGFVWKDGVITRLSDLVSPDVEGVDEALEINNSGQIVATATRGDTGGAARLTPIPPILGDFNCDRIVDVNDLLAVISHWGPAKTNGPADFNGDGIVNVDDLLIVINNWG